MTGSVGVMTVDILRQSAVHVCSCHPYVNIECCSLRPLLRTAVRNGHAAHATVVEKKAVSCRAVNVGYADVEFSLQQINDLSIAEKRHNVLSAVAGRTTSTFAAIPARPVPLAKPVDIFRGSRVTAPRRLERRGGQVSKSIDFQIFQ